MTKKYWYRKPRVEILEEHLLVNGDNTISIISEVSNNKEESEKLTKLLQYAKQLGIKYLGTHTSYNEVDGIKTKAVQQEECWNNEFRNAIFYECGAQHYLEVNNG